MKAPEAIGPHEGRPVAPLFRVKNAQASRLRPTQKAVESEVTSTSAPPKAVAEPAAGKVMRIDFAVGGMTCAHCSPLVAKALKQVDGVVNARVRLASQTASVDFDPARTKTVDVLEAIRRAGYVPGIASSRIAPSYRSSACRRPTLRKDGNQEFLRKQPWL